jgi:hypothetical protein
MTSTSEQIVPHVHHDFQAMAMYVTANEPVCRLPIPWELTLFWRLLAVGSRLLR